MSHFHTAFHFYLSAEFIKHRQKSAYRLHYFDYNVLSRFCQYDIFYISGEKYKDIKLGTFFDDNKNNCLQIKVNMV